MGIDLYVASLERPTRQQLVAAAKIAGYERVAGAEEWDEWSKEERGALVTEVGHLDEASEAFRAAPGASWEVWFSFSSVPYEETVTDAYRFGLALARDLDGVLYDPQCGEAIPLDYEPKPLPGPFALLRGLGLR